MPPTRPRAILCDLDGTLIHAPTLTSLDNVRVDTAVLTVLEGMGYARGWRTVFVSDRSERQRDGIAEFLSSLDIHYADLILRDVADTSPATHFKRWALDMVVTPKYDVRLVLEDDPAVAKVFRTLDLSCFLVSEWKSPQPASSVALGGQRRAEL